MRLPTSLQRWVDGLKAGNGPRSQLSRSTIDGGTPDPLPTVLSFSDADGLKGFHIVPATSWLLREDDTGELTFMASWDLDPVSQPSLFAAFARAGVSGAIAFDVLIPVSEGSGTLVSTSRRPRTSGISGVPCDRCRQPILPGSPYVQVVDPPADSMWLYHKRCAVRLYDTLRPLGG